MRLQRNRGFTHSFTALIRGAIAVSLLFLSPLLWAQTAGSIHGVETDVGSLYFRSALSLFQAGKISEAESLLHIAIEYNDTDSDYHFLLGRILSEKQEHGVEAMRQLRIALNLGQFHTFVSSDCAIALARMYLRTRQYTRGISLLQQYVGQSYVDVSRYRKAPIRNMREDTVSGNSATGDLLLPPSEPAYVVLLAALLKADGRVGQARSIIDAGRGLFPDDVSIIRAAMLLDPVPSLGTSEWLDDHESSSPAYLDFLLDYIRRLPDGAVRTHFLDVYFANGGDAPEAWAWSAGQDKGDAAALAGFIAAGGLPSADAPTDGRIADAGLIRLLASRITDSATEQKLKQLVASYTGTLGIDENHDGFFEQELTYSDGKLVTWVVDNNQDGEPELTMHLKGDRIVSVDGDRSSYTVDYSNYPRVASVTFLKSAYRVLRGDVVTYEVPAGSLDYSVLAAGIQVPPSGAGVLDELKLASSEKAVSEQAVRSLSYRALARLKTGGEVRKVVFMKRGVPYLMAVDNSGKGIVDEIVEYSKGVPTAAIRDLNDDGYFEESEFYTDGKVSYIAVDGNKNGIPDFFQQLSPQASYSWDLNGDGKVDIKDIMIAKNRIKRLFSSQLDGRLNGSVQMRRFLPMSTGTALP